MTNPNDPLLKSGPERQRELFEQFCALAKGFSVEDVTGAAANVMANGIREAYPTLSRALNAFDEKAVKTRELIATHYDRTGRRRNVFPFHQVVEMPHFDASKKG